jgi:flagellin
MRINTNVSSLTAQEANVNTNNSLANSLEKLSSGLKINKAADDASGLAIADKLRTQATSINQGVDNGNSAVALLQIADKSMAEQSNILDTVKAKLIQANTDTTSADGREAIRKDIAKLLEQLDNIAKQTNYNGTTLLQASRADDSASSGLSFQVGENDGDLITNTSIQSNTQGLAGAELSVAAAATAGTDDLSTGDAQLVKHGGTTTAVTLTAASGTASVSLSGKVGVLGAASGESLTISNVSSADKLQLDALAVSNADFTNNNDGTYTLTNGSAASTLDLGSYNVNSITVDSSTTIISLTGDTANDRFSVQNLATAVTTIAGGDTGTTIGLSLDSLRILGEDALTQELADIYQGVVDTSISTLNSYRGDIGSTQNQVESAVRNLMTQATNVQAAESIIRDVDYAAESANFNKQNIISQAGSYAISQANSVQQNVLRLLQ